MNSFISARLHAHNDDPKMLMFSRFFKFTTGYDVILRLTGVYLVLEVLEVLSTVTLRTFENSRIAQKSKKMENRLKLEYSMYM